MRIWRINFDDSCANYYEWFGTKKEAVKRWNEVIRDAKKAEQTRTIESPCGVAWTLYSGQPELVKIPDRKDDLIIFLNIYFNNADGTGT
jgi:hypothetical protein